MESELSRLLNLQSRKAKLFLANKPYESPAEAFCLRELKNELGVPTKLKLNFSPSISASDAVLVPFELSYWHKNKRYISYLKSLAKQKKLIILNTADFIPKIRGLNNEIYLRPFLNPNENSVRSIVIPYEINSLDRARSIVPDFKVSFMGYVPRIFSRRLYYAFKNSFWHPLLGNGAIIRKIMIYKLRRTNLPQTIVIRDRFGGWKRDKSANSIKTKNEFINSIVQARYIACPRGDGNSSIRFYETLSAGRVPILVDTEMKLPLENLIDYNKFTISLSIKDSAEVWEKKIRDFDANFKDDKFKKISLEISEIFDKNLSMYNYFRYLFTNFLSDI